MWFGHLLNVWSPGNSGRASKKSRDEMINALKQVVCSEIQNLSFRDRKLGTFKAQELRKILSELRLKTKKDPSKEEMMIILGEFLKKVATISEPSARGGRAYGSSSSSSSSSS